MNEKNFHFNIVDVIVAVIWISLIAVLFGIFLIKHSRIVLVDNKVDVEITLEVQKSPSAYYGLISNNDTVRISDTGVELGTVNSVEYNRSSISVDENGNETGIKFYPDLQDYTITVEAKAEFDGDNYYVNEMPIRVSDEITFEVPKFTANATITAIEVSE